MSIDFLGGAQLLGTLHQPRKLRPRTTAVLLCNPFGEEAARAHRIFRVLATQIERAGYAALRFDYSCTGDSLGDSAAASVEGWVADVGNAAAWLREATGATRIAVVGLRLGATLAMMANGRGELRSRHVILWDPVIDGRGYLGELVANHQAYMRAELGDDWRSSTVTRADGTPTESLGTPISERLAAELAAIDLGRAPPAELMTVITTRASPASESLRARWPATRWVELTESPAWNTDAALNSMTVPMDIVKVIVARIEETCP